MNALPHAPCAEARLKESPAHHPSRSFAPRAPPSSPLATREGRVDAVGNLPKTKAH